MTFAKSTLFAGLLGAVALSGCATTSGTTDNGIRVLPMEDFVGLGAALQTQITFAQDQRTLSNAARRQIASQLPLLRTNESARVLVTGHASAEGEEEYNLDLSVDRGIAVAQYLAENGIARERMAVIGFGETRPNSDIEDGRSNAANRRAELYVY